MQYRIMLVDDEANILQALRRVLHGMPENEIEGHSLEIQLFTSPVEALQRADYMPFDLVMTDYRMPEMNGVEFLVRLRQVQPTAMRLILSAYADRDGLVGAINEAQIFRFIAKPWNDYELRATVAQALSYRHLLMENLRLADLSRVQLGKLSKQEMELRRLEEEHPGITKVNWGPDGSVLLDM
ncbi:response regulator [Noviherbaspirillum sedimenti]|uniref:Response regulator n=1 Tax=Noviherbaspirillum sedimenti TaxID=2320865 RepID=A0A3A3FZB1_9BURK|nr:response regulator [Noviherbaspirillum sedimenti]RJG01044.1 response regulator [Noviherbaspirillum sedimenti]